MEYDQPTPNYNPEVPSETPYKRAQQEWDQRIGNARVQAKNWRLAAFACIFLSLLSVIVIILVYLSVQPTIIPYVIEVDKAGEVRQIGPVKKQNYVPRRAAIEHFIARFVDNIRTIPIDPVILGKQWREAWAFVSGIGINKLNTYLQENNPVTRMKLGTVSVQVLNIIASSETTYRITWKEDIYNPNGVKKETNTYEGLFTITFKTPPTEEDLRKNPLGIYIVNFDWDKLLKNQDE